MFVTKIIFGPLVFFVLGSSFAGAKASSREIVDDFLHNYCYDCHDSASEKGEREFESLKIPFESIQDLVMAREIIDHSILSQKEIIEELRQLGSQRQLFAAEAG